MLSSGNYKIASHSRSAAISSKLHAFHADLELSIRPYPQQKTMQSVLAEASLHGRPCTTAVRHRQGIWRKACEQRLWKLHTNACFVTQSHSLRGSFHLVRIPVDFSYLDENKLLTRSNYPWVSAALCSLWCICQFPKVNIEWHCQAVNYCLIRAAITAILFVRPVSTRIKYLWGRHWLGINELKMQGDGPHRHRHRLSSSPLPGRDPTAHNRVFSQSIWSSWF